MKIFKTKTQQRQIIQQQNKFLHPIKSNNFFTGYKTFKFIVKTVKNTQVTRFQKQNKNSSDFKE